MAACVPWRPALLSAPPPPRGRVHALLTSCKSECKHALLTWRKASTNTICMVLCQEPFGPARHRARSPPSQTATHTDLLQLLRPAAAGGGRSAGALPRPGGGGFTPHAVSRAAARPEAAASPLSFLEPVLLPLVEQVLRSTPPARVKGGGDGDGRRSARPGGARAGVRARGEGWEWLSLTVLADPKLMILGQPSLSFSNFTHSLQ